MAKHDPAKIRNLALVGGPRTGKTSLAEAMLHAMGATQRRGAVKDGTTASDIDPEEKEKQHSIFLGVLHGDRKGTHFNVLDTPGYPDFVGEAVAGMAACETAVFCVSATDGLTFPGRRLWGRAGDKGRARCLVITHVDHADADPLALVEELGEALGVRCVPVVVPDGAGASFKGVTPVPLAPGGAHAELAEALVEAVVEIDEEVMTRYLEEDVIPDEAQLADLLRRSVAAGMLVPAFFVNALDGAGVETFLELAPRYLPSPLDGPFYRDEAGEAIDPGRGASAFVFKTIIDPFVGKLCLVRVVSGELSDAQPVLLSTTGKTEKLAALHERQGKEHSPLHTAVAGDIAAVAKMEHLDTGATVCDPAHPVTVQRPRFPRAMVARSIAPADHADDVKLSTLLRRVASEDPTFIYDREEATGQLVVRGVTLMHLETTLRRVSERHKIQMKVDIPRVALRETCTLKADGHHRHKKQTGGRGQFAEVYLRVAPGERGTGLTFLNETVGGSIPKNFIPAVEKGVRDVMAKGVIAGYPVVDVVVGVTDGKHHDVDSDEASFKLAGGRAFKDAFAKARPVLLEPIVDMEVAIPSRFMGAITSDMTGRRGHIGGMDALGDIQVIRAHVPQREVLTYPTALHSMTSGEGTFTAEFHDYEIVPPNVQQEIMAEYKPAAEED